MRLLACISHHGFGHLAQTAPVLNSLAALRPDIQLVLRSALPRERLAARIHVPFQHFQSAVDCGFSMRDALRIDLHGSLAAYTALHRNWEWRVDAEARWLVRAGISLVFSNVAYLPLAAARCAGLPAVAMCSLNWADLFAHYFACPAGHAGAEVEEILVWETQMRSAYRSVNRFLRPTPAMAMDDIPNRREISPIAALGRNARDALRSRLGVGGAQRLVLIGMGGIGYRPSLEDWPAQSDVMFVVPDEWRASRSDMRSFSAAGMPFIDILASCDALVTKPGYGSFTEAAAHGVPVLYLVRPDWPESPVLEAWLHANTRALRVEESAFNQGRLATPLARLWQRSPPPVPNCGGAMEAAQHLAAMLV